MQTKITQLIETWTAENMAEALLLLKNDAALEQVITARYRGLWTAIGGKTLKSLVDLPAKWEKANNAAKANCIAAYPQDLPFFTNIIRLNANLRVDAWRDSHYTHQIAGLPTEIGRLKNVTELHLVHQEFKELPEALGEMENLEVLNLEDCDLSVLPDFILKLTKLRVLILTQNYGLETIPDLATFPNLEEVSFTYTRLNTLSDAFFELKNIKKITTENSDFDKNLAIIRRMQKSFPNAKIETYSQKAIDLEDNANINEYKDQENIRFNEFKINYLPDNLFAANAVKNLEIDCWSLLAIPDTFDNLQTLETLVLQTGSTAMAFPKSICKLKNLKSLHLKRCNFDTLPDEFGDLTQLEHLTFEGLKIEKLPVTFYKLKNLKTLNVEYGSFDVFSAITACVNLENLTLKSQSVPFIIENNLTQLVNLREVKLDFSNKITDDIYKLPQTITRLDIEDNSWQVQHSAFSFGQLLNFFVNLDNLRSRNVDFSDISEAIHPNTNLKTMLSYNAKFAALPDSFSNLQALEDLTIFGAKELSELNPALYDCTNLKYLRTSQPLFTTIPAGVSKLKNLLQLGFENGNVQSLPDDIYTMQHLQKIAVGERDLYKNKEFKTLIKRKIKGIKIVKNWYD